MMVKFYYMPTRKIRKRLTIVNTDENEEKLELSYNHGKLV